jgi:hypothetical protein
MDPLMNMISYDPKKAWEMVAEWYLDDLYRLLHEKNIEVVLALSPEEAITHLGKYMYKGQRHLYAWNRYHTTIEYPDLDTESTDIEIREWRENVWSEIIPCMIEVSHSIGETLKYKYDTSFANDFLSLSGSVDNRVIYGMFIKNSRDQEEDSSSYTGTIGGGSDSEYEPDTS